jgi:hypothetical protein
MPPLLQMEDEKNETYGFAYIELHDLAFSCLVLERQSSSGHGHGGERF